MADLLARLENPQPEDYVNHGGFTNHGGVTTVVDTSHLPDHSDYYGVSRSDSPLLPWKAEVRVKSYGDFNHY